MDFISRGNMKGFRDFISRGNMIELAVAVVIGRRVRRRRDGGRRRPDHAADRSDRGSAPNFAGLTFTVHKSTFKYGALINAIVTFLIIAAVIYFLIIVPMARITARFAKQAEVTTRDCPEWPQHDPDRGVPVHVLHRPRRPRRGRAPGQS